MDLNIKNFFKRASKYITRYGKSKIVPKENIYNWLSNIISMLQLVDNTFSKLSNTDRKELRVRCLNNLPYVNDKFFKNFLKSYTKDLKGKALRFEVDNFLGSYQKANKKLLKLMIKFNENLDDLFKNENVQIDQIRLSQLSVLGIMTDADRLGKYTIYLLSCIFDVSMLEPKSKYSANKYKLNILESYYKRSTVLVNQILNKNDKYTFLEDIKKTYNSSYDFTLGVISGNSNIITTILNKIFNFPLTVQLSLTNGLFGFGILSTVVDLYNQYQYDKMRQIKNLKEWMEQRTALLRMELQDKNNPEEREKLKKIINNYEDMIAKYERKINDYELSIED